MYWKKKNIRKTLCNYIWFFKKINKIGTSLLRLIRTKKSEDTNHQIKNERISFFHPIETKMIIREYYKQFYVNELDNLDKKAQMSSMRRKLPKVTQEKVLKI